MRDDAIVALVKGDTDRAIGELAEAAAFAPSNAGLWSDLAAAHLQRATAAADPNDYVLALTAADRAVEREPVQLAARFNRALTLGHLGLRAAASADWRFLLARERDPGWRKEEQARATQLLSRPGPEWNAVLKRLQQATRSGDERQVQAIVSGSPQLVREYVEEELLPAWANESGSASRDSLALARALGKALAAISGERMVANTVAQIDGLNPTGRETLAEGFRQYGAGISLLRTGSFSAAIPDFQAAERTLANHGSPFAAWASCQIAYCLYQGRKDPPARERLLTLLRKTAPEKYRALHARALWLLGVIAGLEGSPTAARTAFESSLADFQQLHEGGNAASQRALLAYHLFILGRRAEAWRCLHPALLEPLLAYRPRARSLVYEVASAMAREQGNGESALWFYDELLRAAQDRGTAYAIAEALRGRAALLASLGRNQQATIELERARAFVNRVADPSLRQSLEGNLRLVAGELVSRTSPQRAVADFDRAIEIFQDTSYHFQLSQAFYERALAEISLGRNDEAERDLVASIAETEQQREKVLSPEDRIAFFDRTRGILDTMIDFQLVQRRDSQAALRFSEQAKARVLWDWILTQPTGALDPQKLALARLPSVDTELFERDLPAGVTVIEYALLPRRTVAWILQRGKNPKEVTMQGGEDVIGKLVQQLHSAVLEDRSTVVKTTAEMLYGALIEPLEPYLTPGEHLVVVPDGSLHTLPFALLRKKQTRRYLIQDYVCSVAPSLRIFRATLKRYEALSLRSARRALVIADPEFNQALFPGLLRLPADRVAAAVTRAFPGSLVLRDAGATRRAFLSRSADFEIVHFGGHSLVNSEFPLLSQMVFASEAGDPARGVLYSEDLLRQRFPSTQLVVLASCSTAAGRLSRTEGVENLTRPFLAAGAPAVVASLWNVENELTEEFFARFYRKLETDRDVARVLQATQIDFIEHGTGPAASPKAWAAFELIGASIEGGRRPPPSRAIPPRSAAGKGDGIGEEDLEK